MTTKKQNMSIVCGVVYGIKNVAFMGVNMMNVNVNMPVFGNFSSNLIKQSSIDDEYNELCNTFADINICSSDAMIKVFWEMFQKRTERFCYFRCIVEVDRCIFLTKLIQTYNNQPTPQAIAMIVSGGIVLNNWISIMNDIQDKLNNTYILYRKSYWGEHARRFSNTTIYNSSYVCELRRFGTKGQLVHILYDGLHHLMVLKHPNVLDEIDLKRNDIFHTNEIVAATSN